MDICEGSILRPLVVTETHDFNPLNLPWSQDALKSIKTLLGLFLFIKAILKSAEATDVIKVWRPTLTQKHRYKIHGYIGSTYVYESSDWKFWCPFCMCVHARTYVRDRGI